MVCGMKKRAEGCFGLKETEETEQHAILDWLPGSKVLQEVVMVFGECEYGSMLALH